MPRFALVRGHTMLRLIGRWISIGAIDLLVAQGTKNVSTTVNYAHAQLTLLIIHVCT